MTYIESAARMIAEISDTNKIIVEKSTVPVKAAESILNILRANHKPGVKYQVSIQPITSQELSIRSVLNQSQARHFNWCKVCVDIRDPYHPGTNNNVLLEPR